MAAAAAVIAVVGAVVGAYGQYSDGKSREAAADRNASTERRNAKFAFDQGELEVAAQARRNFLRTSAARAGYAASGVTSEGSPLDVLEASAAESERDTQNIRMVANAKAQGYTDSSVLDDMRAKNAANSGNYGAAGSLLSGASKAYYYGSGTGTPIKTGTDD